MSATALPHQTTAHDATADDEPVRADVVVVGAGLAGLATAYTLARRSRRQVIVIDKGRRTGAHSLSGALVDRRAWLETFGQLPPDAQPVTRQRMVYLTGRRHLAMPALAPIRGSDCFLASYGRLCAWAADRCEELGVQVHSELSAQEPIIDDGRVAGLRLLGGDEVVSDCVVLAEGACGVVTGKVLSALMGPGEHSHGDDPHPRHYALGLKVLVEADGDDPAGQVYHTIGFPLGPRRFGGGFIYGIGRHIHVGLVMGLDRGDADFDPHGLLQQYLHHPFVRSFMERGRLVGFGAKILDETGYHGLRPLAVGGAALVGEAAGLLNSMKLKGVGLALTSGRILGQVLAERSPLEEYPRRLRASPQFLAFVRARNVHAWFRRGGLPAGMAATALAMMTRGLLPPGPPCSKAADTATEPSPHSPRPSSSAGNGASSGSIGAGNGAGSGAAGGTGMGEGDAGDGARNGSINAGNGAGIGGVRDAGKGPSNDGGSGTGHGGLGSGGGRGAGDGGDSRHSVNAGSSGHHVGGHMGLRSSLMHLTRVANRGPAHILWPRDPCESSKDSGRGRCDANGRLRELVQLCLRICPAGVYAANGSPDDVLISHEDCLHCGACRAMASALGLEWSPPVDGPRYDLL